MHALRLRGFRPTQVANDLPRTAYHNLKLAMDFNDGPGNDLVRVYIDDALVHTGTSWEDYFRYDPEASADQNTRTVDSLMLRARARASPANIGNGYLVDNLSLTSSTVPAPTTVVQAADLTTPDGGGWLFYNDTTDTFDNTPGVFGSFVHGPAGQPLGIGSAEVTIPGTGRTNLATHQFSGTPLESITQLGWTPPLGARFADVPCSTSTSTSPTRGSAADLRADRRGPRSLADLRRHPGRRRAVSCSGCHLSDAHVARHHAEDLDQILADYPDVRIRVADAHVGSADRPPRPRPDQQHRPVRLRHRRRRRGL